MKDAHYSPWRRALLAIERREKAFWAWGNSGWIGAEEETEYRRSMIEVERAIAAVSHAEQQTCAW